jgi:2-polyprenyl-3-methyl-5-hydroxy-6-metoxy-1,4-benzoquinol methylase
MSIRLDSEDSETNTLFAYVGDFAGKRVLEIGCGDGRLTWQYAPRAARIVAIDPDADEIKAAREDLPPALRNQVEFHTTGIAEFEPPAEPFDIVILSWALC